MGTSLFTRWRSVSYSRKHETFNKYWFIFIHQVALSAVHQRTRDVEPILVQFWITVYNTGPARSQSKGYLSHQYENLKEKQALSLQYWQTFRYKLHSNFYSLFTNWSCVSLPRRTTSCGWKFIFYNVALMVEPVNVFIVGGISLLAIWRCLC